MTRDEFWALVGASLGDAEQVPVRTRRLLRRAVVLRPGQRHTVALEQLLAQLPDAQLLSFQEHLDALRDDLATGDLRGAARVAGLDDDGFTDLRTWLVSQGRAAYERVRGEPDALVDVAPPDLPGRLADAEGWGYVALELWDAQRGDEMPRPAFGTGEVRGEPVADPEQRYPRLVARYRSG